MRFPARPPAASVARRRSRRLATLAAAAVAASASASMQVASSHAHVGGAGGADRTLQQLERRLLGLKHAAEHRIARRMARLERGRWRRMSPVQRRRGRRYAARLTAADPSEVGRWTSPFPMPVIAVHTAVLPTGKVMLFSQKVNDYKGDDAAAYLWDPAKAPGEGGQFTPVPPPVNIWCSAQSLLSDGQLLVSGGNLAYATATSNWKGLRSVLTFDPWSETWTRQPDMPRGRWYPTQTLLPDGRTMITAGYDDQGDPLSGREVTNTDIDVFEPPAERGGQGRITTIARYGRLTGSPSAPHWYPHWFVMPSGGVLNAGYTRGESWLLDPTPGAVSGADRPNWAIHRRYGTAVLLPGTPAGSTRVMQLGGYDQNTEQRAAVASTETFDEATPTTPPQAGPTMQVARASHNTVLLPDGSMVSVGGGYGEQPGTANATNANDVQAAAGVEHRQIEILDAGADAWRLGPPQTYKRSYHSTAVLLPDGRVLSAGDDRDPAKGLTFRERDLGELYEPAYLHRPGVRPAILAAPLGIDFGERFAIETSTPIASAVLMSPGATTHANDMGQRLVALTTRPRTDGAGAELTAPPNANAAVPGYYMLFALSANGKPSVARWVYVGESRPEPQRPTPTESEPTPVPPPADPPPADPSPAEASPAPSPAPPVLAPPVATPPVLAPLEPPLAERPRVSARIVTTLRELRRRGRLRVRVSLDRPGYVDVSVAVARRGARTAIRVPRSGSVRVSFERAGTKGIVARLDRRQRRHLRGVTRRVTTTLRAGHGAGSVVTRRLSSRLPR